MGLSESTINNICRPCSCLAHVKLTCKSKCCTWCCEMFECNINTNEEVDVPLSTGDSHEPRRSSKESAFSSNESYATQAPIDYLPNFQTKINTKL